MPEPPVDGTGSTPPGRCVFRHPGASADDYFSGAASGLDWVVASGPGWAAAHAAFGVALVIAAIAAVALARGHGRWAVGRPALGALAVIGAGFNGVSFVNYGHAFSSMIMAGLWALALACYVAGAIRAAIGIADAAYPAGLTVRRPMT